MSERFEHVMYHGKSRFLARLCNKTYGIRSRRQRIETDRETESLGERNIRVSTYRSVSVPRQDSEIKTLMVSLGDVIKSKGLK